MAVHKLGPSAARPAAASTRIPRSLRNLSDLLLNGLSLTAGGRESKDYTRQVYYNFARTAAGLQTTTFNHVQLHDEKAPTYTFALNYQVTPDLMTYITTRTGFKPGGVNGSAAAVRGVAGVVPT